MLGACSSTGGTGAGQADDPVATGPTSSATTTPPSDGGVSAPTVAPEPDGADPTTTGSPDRCHTSELTGDLLSGDAAAGQQGATLALTNTGGDTCTVVG